MGAKATTLMRVPDQAEESKKAKELLVKTLRPLVKKVLGGPPIRTDDAFQEGSDARRVVVTTKKDVMKRRKSITTHMDAAKRGVMALFRPMETECDEALEQIDGKLEDYEEWKEARAEVEREKERKREQKRLDTLRRNELKKLAEAESRQERLAIKHKYLQKEDVVKDEAAAAQAMVDDSPPQAEGTSTRKLWDFEILNFDEIPNRYLIREVNGQAVRDYCRNVKNPEIRGLRLFQKSSRASRKF